MSFTYKVPSNASGGEYVIKVFNNLTPTSQRMIRIRSLSRQELIVTSNFDKESYFPGDTLNGILKVSLPSGANLQVSPKFTYNVNFGVSTI